jgi:hypothetical protein
LVREQPLSGTAHSFSPYFVSQTSDGFMIAGVSSETSTLDFIGILTNSQGERMRTIFFPNYSSPSGSYPRFVRSNNGTIFSAYGSYGGSAVITQINRSGEIRQTGQFSFPPMANSFFGLNLSTDGNLLIIGRINSQTNSDIYFMKVSTTGSIIFSRTYPLAGFQSESDAIEVSDGYYLTYSTRGETPGILRLDLNGNIVR